MRKRKNHLALMAATVLLVLTACSEESIVTAPAEPQTPPVAADNSGNVYITGDDFTWELGGGEGEGEGDASSIRPVTRSTLTIEEGTARFTWTPGDRVGILPDQGAQVWFEIPESETPTATATFDGGAWALKPTSDYAAYYPFVKDFDLDRTQVPVLYTGQVQAGGNSTAHLGAYDYQGARPSTTNASGGVTFDFDHVGALVLLQFTVPEAGTQLTGVTLSADGATFTTAGTYDLTSTDGFPITPTATAASFTIGLDHTTTVADEAVTLYFMCAPIDLSGKTVNVSVAYGTEGKTYNLMAEGKNLQAAGGYLMEAKVIIDGTLGGKATATEDDITALVEKLEEYVDNGITTITVPGSQLAMITVGNVTVTAIGEAIYRLSGNGIYSEDNQYNGKIDLILQDVAEIVDEEFYSAYALNSITLPKVTTVGNGAFVDCSYLRKITFGSVVTSINQSNTVVFHRIAEKIDGCDLVLNCGQLQAEDTYKPNLENNVWFKPSWGDDVTWKSITLTHTGECDECKVNQ